MCISFEYPIKGESIFLDYHLLLRFFKGRLCLWRGVQRCTEGCVEVCRGAQRCTEVCRGAQRCAEVHGGVCGGVWRGIWRCMDGCTEVHGGVCRGVQRCTEGCTEVCGGALLFVLGYHWLPLATIDLVGDNREFEV